MSSRWMAVLQQRQAGLAKKDATCQKCLQKGHWTYECKNPRKYVHRTSRSHELSKHVKKATKRKLEAENVNLKKMKDQSSSSDSSSSSESSSSDSSKSDDSSSSSDSSDETDSAESSSSSSSDDQSSSSSSDVESGC